MKIKPLYFFIFFITLILGLILFSFFLEKRNKNWQFFIPEKIGAKSILNIGKNLSFDEQNIYFSDGSGIIYSVNQKNGQANWKTQLADHSPFQITLDENFIYISGFDSHIYCLDKNNGYIKWSYTITDQFWPDTEIVFDENDEFVFFADRGGFLYALDRNSGTEVWKKKLSAIDNTKTFIEGSIHFGFIKQTDEQLIIDHFPSSTILIIDKKNGEIITQEKTELKINYKAEQHAFDFSEFQVGIEQNIIGQLIVYCFDKQQNLLIWTYQTQEKINFGEIYQHQNRLYYLNRDNNLLESIQITSQEPNQQNLLQTNFYTEADYTQHLEDQHLQVVPQLKKINLLLSIKNIVAKIKYFWQNFQSLFIYDISTQKTPRYLEFTINHQENFYNNPFTNVSVTATFVNLEQESVQVDGFYYDHNSWKIRAKLTQGLWKWQIKIKTPFSIIKKNGEITVDQNFPKSLNVQKNLFTTDEQNIFWPIGMQTAIVDNNKDGNPLNQISFTKDLTVPDNSQNYRYLHFAEYIDTYKKEANINIFRYGPDNWAPAIWKNLSNNKNFQMDINGNLVGDQIAQILTERDIKIIMSIFSFHPPYSNKKDINQKTNQKILEKYLDYVIARYAVFIDIWELANEATPSVEWQKFISDYINKKDPYHRPITINLEQETLNNSELLSIHLYFSPESNSESNYQLITQINNLYFKYKKNQAMMISEIGFKEANKSDSSADLLRKITWILAFNKHGTIYWDVGFLLVGPTVASAHLGPQERIYLKELQNFLPTMQIPVKSSFEFSTNDELAIYKLENKDYQLFYILKTRQTNRELYQLNVVIDQPSTLSIIEPKNNLVVNQSTLNIGQQYIDLPKFTDDLAIKINREKF